MSCKNTLRTLCLGPPADPADSGHTDYSFDFLFSTGGGFTSGCSLKEGLAGLRGLAEVELVGAVSEDQQQDLTVGFGALGPGQA